MKTVLLVQSLDERAKDIREWGVRDQDSKTVARLLEEASAQIEHLRQVIAKAAEEIDHSPGGDQALSDELRFALEGDPVAHAVVVTPERLAILERFFGEEPDHRECRCDETPSGIAGECALCLDIYAMRELIAESKG